MLTTDSHPLDLYGPLLPLAGVFLDRGIIEVLEASRRSVTLVKMTSARERVLAVVENWISPAREAALVPGSRHCNWYHLTCAVHLASRSRVILVVLRVILNWT